MKQLNWYQIFGKSNIPDGRTVLPTDDIQIWLNCAGIWDKTYTTLAEVLADTTTLLALINSPNAVDYMVRSTTWAVAQALVPTMTGYTTPSGTASASSEWSNDKAWKAFDGVNSGDNRWSCSGSGSQYLQYVFDSPIVADYIEYSIDSHSAYSTNITFSGDGSTLATIAKPTSSGTLIKQKLSVVEAHTTFRWAYTSTGICGVRELQFYSPSITDNSTAMSYIGLNNYCANTLLADSTWCEAICNSEYFESVLNVKVPIMTSATTPSGEVIDSGSVNSNYVGYKAFNGVVSTFFGNRWVSIQYSSSAQVNGQYLGYIFPDSVLVSMLTIQQQTIESYTYDTMIDTTVAVQYSDDNISWTTVKSISLTSATAKQAVKHIVNNVTSHRYHRLLFNNANMRDTQINKYCAVITELQFYGREDV